MFVNVKMPCCKGGCCVVSVKKGLAGILVGSAVKPVQQVIVDGSMSSDPAVISPIPGSDVALYQQIGSMITLQFNFDYTLPITNTAEGPITVTFTGVSPPTSVVSLPIIFIGNAFLTTDALGLLGADLSNNLIMTIQVKDDTNTPAYSVPIEAAGTTVRLSGFLNYYYK